MDDGDSQVTTPPQTVEIQPPLPDLTASFTFAPDPNDPFTLTFTGQASGGTGTYTYSWDFGEGNGGTGNPATHTYDSAGSYNVTLTVDDGDSQVTTPPQTVEIQPPLPDLTASFTFAPDPNDPFTLTFTGQASGGTGSYTYSWDFGDGNGGTGNPATHTYANAGSYTAQVTIDDGQSAVEVPVPVSISQPEVEPIEPDIPSSSGTISPIFQQGAAQETPRETTRFSVIGDQTVTSVSYLDPLATGDYTLSGTEDLQPVIDQFTASNSFSEEQSVATVQDLTAPSADPNCGGQSTLSCYINQTNPSIILIGVGYQDALNGTPPAQFEASLNQAVQEAISLNVIPVLVTTLPAAGDANLQANIDAINTTIFNVAATNGNLPVLNVWRALSTLPNSGVNGANLTVAPDGAGFITADSTFGANAFNYYTLTTLDNIVSTIFP